MRKLIVNFDPGTNFCELVHPYDKRFVAFVSQGVKSLHRKFDPVTKRWSVYVGRLPQVVAAAYRFFDSVDYRAVPPEVQIKIVQFLDKSSDPIPMLSGSRRKTPHEVLFVAPNAPLEVIKAAYWALAQKYHPDHGGDVEKFREIDEAWKELK